MSLRQRVDMSSWLKSLIVLALVVPMTAYVAGSLATSRAHEPADRTPLIIRDPHLEPSPTTTVKRPADHGRSPAATPTQNRPASTSTPPARDVDDDEVRVVTPGPTPVDEDDDDDGEGDHDDDSDNDGADD